MGCYPVLFYITVDFSSVHVLFMFIVHFIFPVSCIPDRLLWIFPEQISIAVSSLHPQTGIDQASFGLVGFSLHFGTFCLSCR